MAKFNSLEYVKVAYLDSQAEPIETGSACIDNRTGLIKPEGCPTWLKMATFQSCYGPVEITDRTTVAETTGGYTSGLFSDPLMPISHWIGSEPDHYDGLEPDERAGTW